MKLIGDGSELHRLKPMKENYDPECFHRMYKKMKPKIRGLVRNVDARRYNVTPDIIESYFWDKMLYVFNKYYGQVSEEHLKANIYRALTTYKNHLLKYAYNERAEFNQSLRSLDELFDDSKEDQESNIALLEENSEKQTLLQKVYDYMDDKLSSDAKLIWEVITNPPPYFEDKLNRGVTNRLLVDFFNMPKTKSSIRYMSELKEDIRYWMERAKKDLA